MLPVLHFGYVIEIISEVPGYKVYRKFPLCYSFCLKIILFKVSFNLFSCELKMQNNLCASKPLITPLQASIFLRAAICILLSPASLLQVQICVSC